MEYGIRIGIWNEGWNMEQGLKYVESWKMKKEMEVGMREDRWKRAGRWKKGGKMEKGREDGKMAGRWNKDGKIERVEIRNKGFEDGMRA